MALRDQFLRAAKAGRLPRRTVRLRLALLYGVVFVLSGAALLATTYFLVDAATGNAFIEHTKDGVTIAGYQIGSPPPDIHGAKTKTSISNGSLKGSGGRTTGSGSSSASTGVGATAAGPVHAVPTQKATRQQQRQVARQQQQFETLAHAYQSSELRQMLIESGIALALMAVISVLLGWLVAGRVLRPLRTITATTRDISASNLHQRLDLRGPDDELKELGDTIDGLLERLEASFRSQRQFVANASHELRTPLARQRTLAQVALSDPDANLDSLRAAHERILASGEQQEQLIDALLTLSRAQATLVNAHEVDLAALVGESLGEREIEAAARRVRIIPALGPTSLRADRRLLERLVGNLLDNALRHNAPGGTVSVQTGSRGGRAWLAVANDGPFIAPDDVARLYEPFERLEPERVTGGEGFGLGLCIVRAVASAHGATLWTVPRATGGLSIEVQFPGRDDLEAGEVSVGTGLPEPGPEGRPAADNDPAESGGGSTGAHARLVHASLSDH
jgi:signal transduction histidine kinase